MRENQIDIDNFYISDGISNYNIKSSKSLLLTADLIAEKILLLKWNFYCDFQQDWLEGDKKEIEEDRMRATSTLATSSVQYSNVRGRGTDRYKNLESKSERVSR